MPYSRNKSAYEYICNMKIFCGDHTIEIGSTSEPIRLPHHYEAIYPASMNQFKLLYTILTSHKRANSGIFLFRADHPELFVDEVLAMFDIIEAAGGIVKQDDDLLFIYRLGKWDLPKGKVEPGEELEEAAVREVQEECGIDVSLHQKIGTSWHSYIRQGKNHLKCTHWYAMERVGNSPLVPQIEEGIEKVVFFDKKNIENIVLPNTYPSIQDILKIFFQA